MSPVDRFFPEGWECGQHGLEFWIRRPDGATFELFAATEYLTGAFEEFMFSRNGEEIHVEHKAQR